MQLQCGSQGHHIPTDFLMLTKIQDGRLTEALALVGGAVYVHLRANHIAERHEHLCKLSIPELLWEMVDEQIAPFWAWKKNHKHVNTDFSGQQGRQEGKGERQGEGERQGGGGEGRGRGMNGERI